MKITFRVDASVQIGTGHVMRCLTLADELARQGHQCQFVCREHKGHLGDLIASKGFDLYLLSGTQGTEQQESEDTDNAHAEWLGVPWLQDAKQTLHVLSSLEVDWLVVDHYALDARWEREIAPVVGRIMVIDDLADRPHQANLLLDQNVLSGKGEKKYRAQVNPGCKLLLGPHYALLGQEYVFLANALPDRDGRVSRVLIFVGGSDPHRLTEVYLKALSASEFKNLQVDVVIGKNHPAPEDVIEIVSKRPDARIYAGLPSLAPLMIRADLMLGAGGTTNWERMCLGLNSIVVSVARNQDEINRELAEQGLIHFLGKAENISVEKIRSALNQILSDRHGTCEHAKNMREVVDGRGCQRVLENLLN